MEAKHAVAIVTGIVGGIVFTLFMMPVAALDVLATALAARGAFSLHDSQLFISVLGYLLYPVCGAIFLVAGYTAVRWAGPWITGAADAARLAALSGLTAGILRALAYDLLLAARPMAASAIYLLLSTRGFDVQAYRALLSGDVVLGYGGPGYAPANLAFVFALDGLIILAGSLFLAIAGGMLCVALRRGKKGTGSRLEPVEQQRV